MIEGQNNVCTALGVEPNQTQLPILEHNIEIPIWKGITAFVTSTSIVLHLNVALKFDKGSLDNLAKKHAQIAALCDFKELEAVGN